LGLPLNGVRDAARCASDEMLGHVAPPPSAAIPFASDDRLLRARVVDLRTPGHALLFLLHPRRDILVFLKFDHPASSTLPDDHFVSRGVRRRLAEEPVGPADWHRAARCAAAASSVRCWHSPLRQGTRPSLACSALAGLAGFSFSAAVVGPPDLSADAIGGSAGSPAVPRAAPLPIPAQSK
jgi:hypothetical protein